MSFQNLHGVQQRDRPLEPRNVYFEAGVARGKGKRLIQTARKGTSLEFDIRNWRTIFYKNATDLEELVRAAFIDAYRAWAASTEPE